jgi:iron(III) transport system substrate-binding protein
MREHPRQEQQTLLVAIILCTALLPRSVAAQGSWEKEWESAIKSGQKEGQVAVMGPAGAELRRVLTEPFQRKYGIRVEYLSGRASEFASRILAERSGGQYLWDIVLGGTTSLLESLIPAGAADPIKPALILPEVVDTQYWRDSRLDFSDNAQMHNLVFMGTAKVILAYNKNLLDPKELRSYRDLLHPKWKGNIASDDPRGSGAGQATFLFFYLHPDLGEAFIRDLAKQELRFIRNHRQRAEWVAHGKIPLMISPSETVTVPLIRQGLPISMMQALKEGSYLTASTGSVVLVNKARHPNAAKVYLNWLLSREGQTGWVETTGTLSRRLDVPMERVEEFSRILPGVRYDTDNYQENMVRRRPELEAVLAKIFP